MAPLNQRAVVVVGGLVAAIAFGATRAPVAPSDATAIPDARAAQNQEPTVRTWQVAAKRYRFEPARIEVFQDDLVKVELRTEDIAHSFTIDSYRIAKRVGPGRPVTFEFRADQPGTFPFYCNLQLDEGCRQMRGELFVKPRR
jgi:heme/copper-type cytochrome/quinol oxidase subunit 2